MTYGDKRYDTYVCAHCRAEWRIGGQYSPDKERETVVCRWCGGVLFSGLTRESFSEWTLLKEGEQSMKKEN